MTAAYDTIADWYEQYVTQPSDHYERVGRLVAELFGRGRGRVLEVCCGTGVNAGLLRSAGWSPVGIDVSGAQLRYAAARLPVLRGDAARLPLADASVAGVAAVHAHTDVDDYPAVLREAARVLAPGGRLVHVGVHPCFCGAFVDRSDPARLVLSGDYQDRSRRFDSWTDQGVRDKVGATHLPLAALQGAVLDAGLRLAAVRESGPAGGFPDLLGLVAVRP